MKARKNLLKNSGRAKNCEGNRRQKEANRLHFQKPVHIYRVDGQNLQENKWGIG